MRGSDMKGRGELILESHGPFLLLGVMTDTFLGVTSASRAPILTLARHDKFAAVKCSYAAAAPLAGRAKLIAPRVDGHKISSWKAQRDSNRTPTSRKG